MQEENIEKNITEQKKKIPYSSPKLTSYGTVVELTKGDVGSVDDGGGQLAG